MGTRLSRSSRPSIRFIDTDVVIVQNGARGTLESNLRLDISAFGSNLGGPRLREVGLVLDELQVSREPDIEGLLLDLHGLLLQSARLHRRVVCGTGLSETLFGVGDL